MKKLHYGFVLLTLVIITLLTGCESRGVSKKQAEAILTEYIQEKYGDTPEFEWIRWFKKRNISQGYYAKTIDGYYIRMNVFDKGSAKDVETQCFDTREYAEIEEAMHMAFADNPLSDSYHVELNPINDTRTEKLWDSLGLGFEQKWTGEIQDFTLAHASVGYRTVFLTEGWSTPHFYITIRPNSLTEYDEKYEAFQEYVTDLRDEYVNMLLYVIVVPPSVPDDALDVLNPEEEMYNFDPSILLDCFKDYDLTDREKYWQKPVIITSQAEGVECYISPWIINNERFIANESHELLATAPPSEPLSRNFSEKYQIISPIYSFKNTQVTILAMSFDFSVMLKDYLAKHPDAQLGKDYEMLEINEYGDVTPIGPNYYNKDNFDSPDALKHYWGGDQRYIYTDRIYNEEVKICFGVLIKE